MDDIDWVSIADCHPQFVIGYLIGYNMLMEKDRIDRRTAILLGIEVAILGGWALSLGTKLYPLTGLMSEPEPGSLRPEDFKRVFVTSSVGISVEDGPKKISLNKDAFAQALYDVSSVMFPEGGPEKLYSVLAKRPLIVRLSPFERELGVVRGELLVEYGDYKGYLEKGPMIIFHQEELTQYYRALKETDVAKQILLDKYVWHEIVHLIQELKNPLIHWEAKAAYLFKKTSYDLGLRQEPDKREEGNEVEATEISVKIADEKLRNTPDLENNWPFGKFFSFS